MALAAGLTYIDQGMLAVADYADRGAADNRNHPHFAGGQTQGRVLAFFCHQLCTHAGGTNQLAAVAGVHLDVVHLGTDRNILKGQAVADFGFGRLAVHDLHAVGQTFGSQNIGFLAICVADQGDVGAAVRIVLNTDYGSGNAVLIPLKINDSVFSSGTAASVTHGNLTLVVAAGILL